MTLTGLLILIAVQNVFSCAVCKKNQPAGLEGITHGAGPEGTIDYIISWSAVIIVGVTLFLSIKYLVKPRESNADHIKNIILNDSL